MSRARGVIRPTVTTWHNAQTTVAFKSPLEDFAAAVRGAGLTSSVTYMEHGDTLPLAPIRV